VSHKPAVMAYGYGLGLYMWCMMDWRYANDLIQGQGHEIWKLKISFDFENLSPALFTVGAGKWLLILQLESNI